MAEVLDNLSEDDSSETTSWQRSKQLNREEPELGARVEGESELVTTIHNIFPTCENGENFDCQENKSNEVLDESCKGILMFTNETSSCYCRGQNGLKRRSRNILRWVKTHR